MARRRWPACFILTAGLVLATGAIPAAGAAPDHEIRLLSQRFTPPASVPETARQAIGRRAEELRARGKERLHLLVQLHEIPSPAGRAELARQGLDLGAFVPGSAFIAAVPVGRAVAAVARPEVRWATLWETGHKLHPRVAAGDWAPWTRDPARPGMVAAMLLLHHDVPLAAGPALAEKVGGVALPAVEGLHGMTVWLPPERVAELAAEEEVLWIEEAPPPLTPTNDGVRSGMRAAALADAPYGLTGSGVRLFVFDEGTVRRTHETFNPGTGSRVTLIDGTPTSSHATHIAGTAAGDGSGSAGGRGRGVAPGVSVLSAGYQQVAGTMLFWDNAGDIEADYALARRTHLADLGTNSIGSNTAHNGYPCEREGDYGVASSLIDSIVAGANAAVGSPVLMTWAAGNERNAGDIPGRCGSNYGTTAPPSCAKNPLHVGAVNSDGLAMTEFSSWGPCDDGRLKPTLVAPGCETGLLTGETGVFSSTAASDSAYGSACGTSKATPGVAGAASLLIQDWRQQGLGDRPDPALIKAILIHTARDLGPEGPDYVYGYGAVDAKAAIDLLRGNDSITRGWITGTVEQDEIQEHYINGPWQDLDEAKVTLVWDDPAAAPFAAEALVNDLTLEYRFNGSIPYRPWVLAPASPHLPATRGVDSRNNVEQIVVRDVPMSDTLMRVIGTRVPRGSQSYALVFSFNPVVVDKTACTVTSSTFETGTDGWTLAGAMRTLAPASGHGAESVRLGGAVDTFHQATRAVAVPSAPRAELAFWWYMTTEESLDLFGFGFDPFTVEIRNSSGAVLAVVDLRNDGWPQGRWLQHKIDLTPWAGQTVTIAFTATNDFEAATTFWIDDVTLTSCPKICNTGGSTAAVSVTPVDDPPVAMNDAATVVEDSGANAINVLANDTDPDGGPISIISVTQPANGTVAITGCGTGLIYAPNANYCNSVSGVPDTFTYTLTPGGSTATMTMTVTCSDDPPTAVNDTGTVAEDSPATAINVLANDTDPDAGPISITSVTQPANGAVVITGGGTGLTYQPNANYCNSVSGVLDTFTYTLTPGGSTPTVTVTVNCVDDAPVAVADAATVTEDSGANTIHVLSNDTDIDGGPKTIESVTQPANGTVVITNGGADLTYAPNENYCNTPPGTKLDTFTYTLTPGGSTATVTVTAHCVDDPPAPQAQTLDQTLSGCNGVAPMRTIQANPSTYRSLIAGLLPGDRLQLAAGTYTQGLPLHDKHGEPGNCIVIEGPASGSPALFTGLDNGNNLVSLKNSSYIALRNLTLDGLGRASDGIRAEATAVSVHHILIEGLSLKNFNQSGVAGISTKCPAWNWVVRHTTITSTFTGMNLGDSSGAIELANLLIEHNLVHGTQSYNAVFWEQLSRNTSIGVPSSATTIIRHNVFSKETGSLSGSSAQPNLFVGHWPLSGAGSSDIYQIYGNLFYQNPYETLFQGEGNIALHDNLFVNRTSSAVRIQPREDVPRRIEVFNNTVVVGGNTGILVTGADPAYPQRVVGNAVFAGTPLTGGQQSNNVTGTYAQASTYLNNPMAALGSGLDLYPKTGQLQGTAIDHSVFSGLLDYDRDFNGRSRVATYRGAYSGDGVNPGWTPALAIMPSTGNVLQNGAPVTGLSGATGSQQFWTMNVPSGASNLQFQTSGGTGDLDIYVRFGSAPTTTTWDCRPYEGDNNETCSFPTPAAGTWHVMLDGYAAYSGVTLVGSYQAGPTCNSISDVEPNDSTAAPQAISGTCNQISGTFLNDSSTQKNDYFRLSLPAGRTVTALLNGLTVDYDLYIYNAAGTEVASSENGGTNADQASWTNTGASAVNVYILVWRYSSTRTTYQLKVSY